MTASSPLYVIAGSSGFIGQALCAYWQGKQQPFVRLVRRPACSANESQWDPQAGYVDQALLERADAVVNLAGSSMSAGRFTAKRKQMIMDSRVHSTRCLVDSLNQLDDRPRRLINSSGIAYYGSSDQPHDELSMQGDGFLAAVCQRWEAAAMELRAPHQALLMRTGIILGNRTDDPQHPPGGALAPMCTAMRWGLAGRLGNGQQWMSWMSLRDMLQMIEFLLQAATPSGVYNAVSPQPIINTDFMHCLADKMHRPFFMHAPAWALRLRFGEMADALLLASNRILPQRLQQNGFCFQDTDLDSTLQHILEKSDV